MFSTMEVYVDISLRLTIRGSAELRSYLRRKGEIEISIVGAAVLYKLNEKEIKYHLHTMKKLIRVLMKTKGRPVNNPLK